MRFASTLVVLPNLIVLQPVSDKLMENQAAQTRLSLLWDASAYRR